MSVWICEQDVGRCVVCSDETGVSKILSPVLPYEKAIEWRTAFRGKAKAITTMKRIEQGKRLAEHNAKPKPITSIMPIHEG